MIKYYFFLTIISLASFNLISYSHDLLANQEVSLPTDSSLPLNQDGRQYPILPRNPLSISKLLTRIETLLVSVDTKEIEIPRLAHQQQVIYRQLSKNLELSNLVLKLMDKKLRKVVESHISARREFLLLSKKYPTPNMMPAWQIIEPEPLEKLLSYYKKAERSTGIQWEVLAAINLVETGMGRIQGISTANALGPMQFLRTTWDLPGIGNGGDINDPHDSIQAAARYLVSRGGLEDIQKGLWGYNNSYNYGRAVLKYASLLDEEPLTLRAFYNWEIHFNTVEGDLWLPVGYSQKNTIPISIYLKQFPGSAPPDYSSINQIELPSD